MSPLCARLTRIFAKRIAAFQRRFARRVFSFLRRISANRFIIFFEERWTTRVLRRLIRVQAARDLAMDEAAAKVQHVYRRRSSIATSLERRASLKPAETQRVLQQVDELAEDVDVFVNVEIAERDEAVRKLQNAMKRRATRKEEQLRRQLGGL